jgi:predicted DNA-binding WGR domain protein
VICRWGRIGTYGRAQGEGFSWLPEAQTAQTRSVARKHRRGYGQSFKDVIFAG